MSEKTKRPRCELDEPTFERLNNSAHRHKLTMAEHIRRIIRAFLDGEEKESTK